MQQLPPDLRCSWPATSAALSNNLYVPILQRSPNSTTSSFRIPTSRDISNITSTAREKDYKIEKCTTLTMSSFWRPQQARQRMQNTFGTPAEVLHAAVRDDDLDSLQSFLVQGQIQDLNQENDA